MEVKVPRLRVDYDKEEGFSLGKLSLPLIIGFGIHWAWVYVTMFNGRALFFWSADTPGQAATLFYIGSLVFFVISLFAYGLFSRTFRRIFGTAKQRFRNRLIGACLASAGTFSMCFADVSTPLGIALIIFGAVSTGIGSAILLMSYGVSFGQCDIATIVTSTALSFIIAIVVYAIICNLTFINPVPAILTSLLPLVECYCLYLCSSVLVDNLEFAFITLKVRKFSFALRLCAPSMLFGFALGLTRFEAISDMQILGDISIQGACIALGGLIVCVLLIVVMLTQKQFFNFIFRTILPLVTIALLWNFFSDDPSSFASTLIFLICYLLFESIMWINFSDLTQRFRITAFIVFGFGRGSLALGALIGALLSYANTFSWLTFDNQSLIVLVLACMLIGYALLPHEKEIQKDIISESDDPVGEMQSAQSAGAPQSEEALKAGRFKRKCENVSNQYLLSKKETEVLFLLAKGRNAAYIQEQLFISEGTARTHMRHIYKKLDVHTQQELIDLIDAIDPSPELPTGAPS